MTGVQTCALPIYWLVLKKGAQTLTFPGTFAGQPGDWDYVHAEHYSVDIVATGTPLPLFQASRDQERVEAHGLGPNTWTDYVTLPSGLLALRLALGQLRAGEPAATGPAASLRAFFGDKLAARLNDLAGFTAIVVRARASQPGATVKVTLTTKDAVTYSAPLPLGAEVQDIRIPLTTFRPDALLLVPRPYPGFLPLQYQPTNQLVLKLAEIEVLQVIWEAATATNNLLSVDIESISLQ